MCGITGWIAYDRDLTGEREREILTAMTGPLRCRGPEAEGTWACRHAGFGHRRLALIDIEGGRQPMVAEEDGRVVGAITYSGEVYNYRELRRELESSGHRFRTAGDTEVVLRSYLAWGADFVTRLNGMYAFALWDPRGEELLLVRDRMGVKPLYYHPTASGVLFGSEPKALLAHPEVAAVVDADGLRNLLGLVKSPGHTAYVGMREVRPGHTVRVRRPGIGEHRYWELEARPHTDSLRDTVATVRSLLHDTVARQTVADVPLGSMLSGGLDSSTVTVLAAEALREQARGPILSFAVDFVGQAEHFAPDDVRSTSDGPYARAVAAHVAADHTEVLLDSAELVDVRTREAAARAYDLPAVLGEHDTSLHSLFKAVQHHVKVVLSGESADEVFGGYRWFHDTGALTAGTFPWIAEGAPPSDQAPERTLFAPTLLDPTLLDPAVLKTLDLSGHRQECYRQALAEVPHTDVTDPVERRMREVCYLTLTRFLPLLLDRKDRMSMASGLEVRVPYCDHRLVQYVFNTPWSMKTFDGREKSLLRAAARSVLPESVAERVKSPYPRTQDPRYTKAIGAALTDAFDDPTSPVHGLVDVAAARDAMARGDEQVRYAGDVVLALDTWLRLSGARLTL
ncbi:asparagine synthase (glutamine-hydrolyzing) [Streptomyces sp. NPDC018045]|uniref:asparagine synthase (glutamine-hydrolyzing) n=1 Tax=Streptomyces sp. NPDC018045 TaxID=3365037 RepID=UPI0037A97412